MVSVCNSIRNPILKNYIQLLLKLQECRAISAEPSFAATASSRPQTDIPSAPRGRRLHRNRAESGASLLRPRSGDMLYTALVLCVGIVVSSHTAASEAGDVGEDFGRPEPQALVRSFRTVARSLVNAAIEDADRNSPLLGDAALEGEEHALVMEATGTYAPVRPTLHPTL